MSKQPILKLRGVNLGGWLVLEKWMTPSLFEGLQAVDETSYCIELGELAGQTLKAHWQDFITIKDFVWLASIGVNAVRIPIGHWIFGDDYPYHPAYGDCRYPYIKGGIDILDQAFAWAEQYGLKVVLDLHAAPGCQNGFDNGGIVNVCDWPINPPYINYSLEVLERLAKRYQYNSALHAIEVLNEPRWDIATDLLKTYTQDAYQRIRKYCTAEKVAIVFHDGFRSFHEYEGFLTAPTFSNVVFDMHRYQCFTQEDLDLDIYGHINKSITDWKQEADDVITHSGRASYIGEWSLGLDLKTETLWQQGVFDYPIDTIDEFHRTLMYKSFAAAQLLTFEKYIGWFFWSYKTEAAPAWSFKDCVQNGWLPSRF